MVKGINVSKTKWAVVAAVCFFLPGCAAPERVIFVSEKSQVAAIAYQGNMTKVASVLVNGYKKSEKRFHRSNIEGEIEKFAASRDGKVSAGYAKVMARLLALRYQQIEDNVKNINNAIAEASIDFERYLELTKSVDEFLKKSGLQPEHIAALRNQLQSTADDFIEQKRQSNMIKIESAIRELQKRLEEGEEGGDPSENLRKLEEARATLERLRGAGEQPDQPEQPSDQPENPGGGGN